MVEYHNPIKIRKDTHKELLKLRGHNGCTSIDDVIQYLLKLKRSSHKSEITKSEEEK